LVFYFVDFSVPIDPGKWDCVGENSPLEPPSGLDYYYSFYCTHRSPPLMMSARFQNNRRFFFVSCLFFHSAIGTRRPSDSSGAPNLPSFLFPKVPRPLSFPLFSNNCHLLFPAKHPFTFAFTCDQLPYPVSRITYTTLEELGSPFRGYSPLCAIFDFP